MTGSGRPCCAGAHTFNVRQSSLMGSGASAMVDEPSVCSHRAPNRSATRTPDQALSGWGGCTSGRTTELGAAIKCVLAEDAGRAHLVAAQIAIACFQTAKSLGNNPRTLADQTQAAFSRVLPLGTGTAQTQPEPPGSQ